MTERYFITGAQIGTISALLDSGKIADALTLLAEILDKQFIDNMPEPYSDYEIVIRKKEGV
jgi:hypothetical protein